MTKSALWWWSQPPLRLFDPQKRLYIDKHFDPFAHSLNKFDTQEREIEKGAKFQKKEEDRRRRQSQSFGPSFSHTCEVVGLLLGPKFWIPLQVKFLLLGSKFGYWGGQNSAATRSKLLLGVQKFWKPKSYCSKLQLVLFLLTNKFIIHFIAMATSK